MEIEKLFIFLTFVSLILAALDIYSLFRWTLFVRRRGWKKIFFIAPITAAVIMFVLMTSNNYFTLTRPFNADESILRIIVYLWYLPKVLITPVLMLFDLLKFVKSRLRSKHQKNEQKAIDPVHKVVKTRRDFVKTAGWAMSGVPFFLTGKGALINATDIQIREVQIPFFNDSDNHEIRIAQLSDLHLGSFINKDPVKKAIEYIKSLNVDILLLTGDFVNFHPSELKNGLGEFSKLDLPLGVWGCLGNHDHYMSQSYHAELIKIIEKTGIKLLINDSQVIDYKGMKFNLAAVDNYSKRQKFGDFSKTYSLLDDKLPTVLMCHDPWNWDKNILPIRDIELTLAGHTHGGQIALDMLGAEISLMSLMYKYYAGLYEDSGKYIYVNRGLGMSGPPVRLGVNPELTILKLVSKSDLAYEKRLRNIKDINIIKEYIN